MKKLTLTLLLLSSLLGHAQVWESLDEGITCEELDPIVTTFTETRFDEQNHVIDVIGYFNHSEDCEEHRKFAYWDFNEWQFYPSSCGTTPHSIVTFQNEKYAVGGIGCENADQGLYKLGNDQWEHVTSVPDLYGGMKLATINNELYIGTTTTSGIALDMPLLVKYNALEENIVVVAEHDSVAFSSISSIVSYQDTLYIGGQFSPYNPDEYESRLCDVVKVVNGGIERVGAGLSPFGITLSMCVHRDTLFIAGVYNQNNFPGFTNNPFIQLLYYYNGELKPYPVEFTYRITSLYSSNDLLFVGGQFSEVNGVQTIGVCALNGTQVIPLNSEPFYTYAGYIIDKGLGRIEDVFVADDHLYIAGLFDYIGDEGPFGNIAKLSTPVSQLLDIPSIQREFTFDLFPNPASELLQLNAEQNIEGTIEIRNSLGQLVMIKKIIGKNTTIDVMELSPGHYTLTLQNSNSKSTQRFIKI